MNRSSRREPRSSASTILQTLAECHRSGDERTCGLSAMMALTAGRMTALSIRAVMGATLVGHRDEDRTRLSLDEAGKGTGSGSLKSTRFRGMVPICRGGFVCLAAAQG